VDTDSKSKRIEPRQSFVERVKKKMKVYIVYREGETPDGFKTKGANAVLALDGSSERIREMSKCNTHCACANPSQQVNAVVELGRLLRDSRRIIFGVQTRERKEVVRVWVPGKGS